MSTGGGPSLPVCREFHFPIAIMDRVDPYVVVSGCYLNKSASSTHAKSSNSQDVLCSLRPLLVDQSAMGKISHVTQHASSILH